MRQVAHLDGSRAHTRVECDKLGRQGKWCPEVLCVYVKDVWNQEVRTVEGTACASVMCEGVERILRRER